MKRVSLSTAQAPPREFKVGDVTVRTSRLHLSPNYLYECFLNGEETPFLTQISWPGLDDFTFAMNRRRKNG